MPPTYPRMLPEAPPELQVPGGVLLYDPERDGRFPYIFKVGSHPLAHDRELFPNGRILVYIQDTSVDGLKLLEEFEASLEVPLGTDESVSNYGIFEVNHGDLVFIRDMYNPEPEHDIMGTWVNDCTVTHAGNTRVLNEMNRIRCSIVGDEALTKPGRPVKENGAWIGGTAWERCSGLNGVKGSRCYTLGPSHQCSRRLVSPTASAKVAGHTLDEHQVLHRDIVKIAAEVGMAGLRTNAPTKFVERLELLAEATNMPRIGIPDNCAYPTMQLNLSSAIQRDGCETTDMSTEMGHFGQKNGHIDRKDDPGAETSMLSLVSVPPDEGYQPGRFHLLSMGLYIKLDPFKLMGFSGLRKHGGTPPLSPPGKPPADSAYRIMVVMYPPASMLSQSANHRAGFASLPDGKIFALAPEMTSILEDAYDPIEPSNEATWMTDGPVMMPPLELFEYSCRNLLLMNSYFLRQLPVEYQARIDPRVFLSAFSADIDGDRVHAKDWLYAPTGYTRTVPEGVDDPSIMDADLRSINAIKYAVSEFLEQEADGAKFIPHLVGRDTMPFQRAAKRHGPSRKRKAAMTKKNTDSSMVSSKRQRTKQDKGSMPSNDYPVAGQAALNLVMDSITDIRLPDANDMASANPDIADGHIASAPAFVQDNEAIDSVGQRQTRSSLNKGVHPLSKPPPNPSGSASNAKKKRKGKGKLLFDGISVPPLSLQKPVEDGYDADADMDDDYRPPDDSDNSDSEFEEENTCQRSQNVTSEDEDHMEIDSTRPAVFPVELDIVKLVKNATLGPLGRKLYSFGLGSDEELSSLSSLSEDDMSVDDSPYDPRKDKVESNSKVTRVDASEAAEVNLQRHPTESFVDMFSSVSVFHAIENFIRGLRARKDEKPSEDTWSITQNIAITMGLLTSRPSESDTAKIVPALWDRLRGLERYRSITAMELCYTQSVIMMSEWKIINWLQVEISTAYSSTSRSSSGNWLQRLINDIEVYHTSGIGAGKTVEFCSADYLPSLDTPLVFKYKVPRFIVGAAMVRTIDTITNCLKLWLHFPSGPKHILRYKALDMILSVAPLSVLLLDPMWRLYNDPIEMLMGVRRKRQLTTKDLDKVIGTLHISLQTAGFMDSSSPMRLALDVLSDLNNLWMSQPATKPTGSRIPAVVLCPPPLPISSSADDLSSQCNVFIQYLRMLMPIVKYGPKKYLNSKDRMLSRVAKKPDHLLPFRERAPTRIRAIGTIYDGLEDGLTPEDFWNILCHRGTFYGSEFALTHGGRFASFDDWVSYKSGEGSNKEDKFFVSSTAYGPANHHRTLELIEKYWSLRHEWIDFSTNRFNGIMSLFYFLSSQFVEPEVIDNFADYDPKEEKKKLKQQNHRKDPSLHFPNIGKLTALLICGDLANAGLVEKPTVEQMARLMFDVDKGAILGLRRLGMVRSERPSLQEVEIGLSFLHNYLEIGLSFLHNYLETNLTTEEKELIGYGIDMLEHGLCKYTRLVKK